MAKSALFDRLMHFDRTTLPACRKDIENMSGSSNFNAKDRLTEISTMLAHILRYIVTENAARHEVDINKIAAVTASEHHVAATQPTNSFPASGQLAPMLPESGTAPATLNVIVGAPSGTSPTLGVNTDLPDPEPSAAIQTVILRNGSTKVIPPLGSKAPSKTFAIGQQVDLTYIAKFDSPESAAQSDGIASVL